MCIKYIRRYSCPGWPNKTHVLRSTIPCSNPIACEGDGFGIEDVSFSGPCEQHISPEHWATFNPLVPETKSFRFAANQALADNVSRYVDSLLDFWTVLMNEALPKENGMDHITIGSAVEIIARELRCPRCEDDVTICPCLPGQNRMMYNISRAFRTAEAQRLLPILRHRFGEYAVQQAVQQATSYAAPVNSQGPQESLFYDVEPRSHGATVELERKIRDSIGNFQNRRKDLFDQSPELGRVQWSAVNIIGSYVKFDSGVPEEISHLIARAIAPMIFPGKALNDNKNLFGVRIASGDQGSPARIESQRLVDPKFWATYQNIILQFGQLVSRNDNSKRDLNAISVAIADRMEDLRITFHDLRIEERATFHTIAKDLLPVMKHVTTEELERNQANPPAKCTVCKLPFSTQVQEPATPAVGTFPEAHTRENQVHTPVRYEQCAFVPHEHAFCLREWARQLMNKSGNSRKILGVKPKKNWRCNTCYVDPWRAG